MAATRPVARGQREIEEVLAVLERSKMLPIWELSEALSALAEALEASDEEPNTGPINRKRLAHLAWVVRSTLPPGRDRPAPRLAAALARQIGRSAASLVGHPG